MNRYNWNQTFGVEKWIEFLTSARNRQTPAAFGPLHNHPSPSEEKVCGGNPNLNF
jgi:hypothetical protein